MPFPTNRFTAALATVDKQVGFWIGLCSNLAAEVTSAAGYDWAPIDMEHSANDYFSVLEHLRSLPPPAPPRLSALDGMTLWL